MTAYDLLQQLAPAGATASVLGIVAYKLWGKLGQLEEKRDIERKEFLDALKLQGEQNQAALDTVVNSLESKLEELAADYKQQLQKFWEA